MPEPIRVTVVTPAAQALDVKADYADVPAHDGQVGIQHLRAALLTKLGTGVLLRDHLEGVGGVARPTAVDLDAARLEFRCGPGRIDQGKARLAILLAQQFHREFGEILIRVKARDIGIGKPRGLGDEVQHFGAAALPLREVDMLEDIDHLQGGKALPVGRQFMDVITAITG